MILPSHLTLKLFPLVLMAHKTGGTAVGSSLNDGKHGLNDSFHHYTCSSD